MLVLTRKCNESIIISNDIEIKVLKIQGNQVHVGINAPRSVTVYREEIYRRVISENKEAVRKGANDNGGLPGLQEDLKGLPQLLKADESDKPVK